MDDNFETDTPALLCSLEDNIEAEMTVSLLQSAGIPVLRKRHGVGDYLKIYMNMSFYGMDIYVPSKLHAKASEILAARATSEQDYVMDEETELAIQRYKRKNFIKAWVLIVVIGPGGWAIWALWTFARNMLMLIAQ
ncbi:MAG: DUF2007 domain-containing protein [Defluviitaleaceae bacterium]|nr:DUF2007 domain-containing protein [Defluviitaleaceae bacterium]